MQNLLVITKPYLKPALLSVLTFYVFMHFFSGDKSLLSYLNNKEQIEHLNKEYEKYKTEREVLEKQVRMMQPESLNQDLLDEQARRILGVANEDEVIIFLDE